MYPLPSDLPSRHQAALPTPKLPRPHGVDPAEESTEVLLVLSSDGYTWGVDVFFHGADEDTFIQIPDVDFVVCDCNKDVVP